MDDVIDLGSDYSSDNSPENDYSFDDKIKDLWDDESYAKLKCLKRYFDFSFDTEDARSRVVNHIENGETEAIRFVYEIQDQPPLEEDEVERYVLSFYGKGKIYDASRIEQHTGYSLQDSKLEKIVEKCLSANLFKNLEKIKQVKEINVSEEFVQEKYMNCLMPENFSEKNWLNGFEIAKDTQTITEVDPSYDVVVQTYKYLADNFSPHFIDELERWSKVDVPEDKIRDWLRESVEEEEQEDFEENDNVIQFPGGKLN